MDRYVKIRKIGEGSFGKALLVRSKENGKQLVVKEINMSRMQRKERDEARKEVAVLAQLAHPNIVAYKESFEEIGNLFIVMDFCDGGDLYSRINAQRGVLFAEDMVLDWFVQSCLAIKHIHDRKILHRDIKSQNIFLTRHGMVKLGDFGIAKVLNSTVELARTCIGTPYYLSPEICENRPYNNKSDVWSLGCVLYELATLKHAFEAGNMKNLVLKIIRGSYPPPPSRYSYELRSLIAALFKRSPRDRPSMNTILKKPLLQSRIRKFLSESEMSDEFSHTVMHGVKIKKALPPGGPRPLPPAPVAAKKPPTPRYDPVSVYAPSAARRSKESRQSAEGGVRKSSAGNVKRPPSARAAHTPSPVNGDLARKRQELMERERKRQEEAKKKEHQYAKAHKELLDKQKVNRINKAREEGWRGLMESLSSDDGTNSGGGAPVKREDVRKQAATPKPVVVNAAKDKGSYEQYHDWLNKVDAERKNVPRPVVGVAGALAGQQAFNPSEAARLGQKAGMEGARAADKAKVQQDYLQRKREAARYKARAHGDIFGGVGVSPRVAAKPPVPVAAANPPVVSRPSSARSERDAQEEDYLARLRQIRLQNFNERRANKNDVRASKEKPAPDVPAEQDARKKKIEALRAQADERAKRLKDELEKKRKEAYELEQKRLKEKLLGKAPAKSPEKPSRPAVPFKPAPVIPMTEAMKAIGAAKEAPKPVVEAAVPGIGMTAALQAIGAGPKQPGKLPSPSDELPDAPPTVAKEHIQKKKAQILKRLNAKPPFGNAQADAAERGKWGEPVKPSVPEQDRPKWGQDGANVNVLAQISLEETASGMDATSAGDVVIKHTSPPKPPAPNSDQSVMEADTEDAPASSRKQWAGPRGTVLNALQHANLSDTQSSAVSDTPDDKDKAVPPPEPVKQATITISKAEEKTDCKPHEETDDSFKAPAVGSTITVARSAGGGTVVIKKNEETPNTAVSIIVEEEDEPVKQPETDITVVTASDTVPPGGSSPVPVRKRSRSRSHSKSPQVKDRVPAGQSKPLFTKVELDEDEDKKEEKEDEMLVVDVEEESQEKSETEETEKETKDEEMVEEQPVKLALKTLSAMSSGLVLGLTTGHFDVDVKMLRTCSEPDLSKLFKTMATEKTLLDISACEVSASLDAAEQVLMEGPDLEDDNDEEDDDDDDDANGDAEAGGMEYGTEDLTEVLEQQLAQDEDAEAGSDEEKADSDKDAAKETSDKDDKEDEEGDDSGAGDTDEDLETLRETMMSILEKEEGEEPEEALNTSVAKKKKKVVKKNKTVKKTKKKKSQESDVTSGSSLVRQWSNSSVEEMKTMRETMKTLLQPDNDKPKLGPVLENGGGDAKQTTCKDTPSTIIPGRESWQDDDDDGDDDYFEEEDMFSRLEATRVKLEEELGCDTFLEAYKTVQDSLKKALHEDEDEDMEQSVHLVTKILGDTKVHLYPSILQLVMADGAFTEDND